MTKKKYAETSQSKFKRTKKAKTERNNKFVKSFLIGMVNGDGFFFASGTRNNAALIKGEYLKSENINQKQLRWNENRLIVFQLR